MARFQLRTSMKKGYATLRVRLQTKTVSCWLDTHIIVDIENYRLAQASKKRACEYYETEEGLKVFNQCNTYQCELSKAIEQGITDPLELEKRLTAILFPKELESTEEKAKKRIEERVSRLKSLLEYYDYFFQGITQGDILHHQGKRYSEGSIVNWKKFGVFLRGFLNNNYDVTFDEINKPFSDRFTAYLLKKDLMPKTINQHRQTMRKMCNSAAEEGINSNGVSLKVWKEATVKEQEKKAEVYMNEDELNALYDMPLLGERAQIRDMFLLGYFSCQRISDYGHLNKSNFKVDEETGLLLFAITQKKTGTYVEVPIVDSRVKAICEKYNYDFPQIDRRNVNRKIKAIMKELSLSVPSLRELVVTKLTYAEKRSEKNYEAMSRKVRNKGVAALNENQKNEYYKLRKYAEEHNGKPLFQRNNAGQVIRPKYEMISSHTARRSGVTNMYKTGLLDTRQMMGISGHQSEKVFESYIKIGIREQARRTAMRLIEGSMDGRISLKRKGVS